MRFEWAYTQGKRRRNESRTVVQVGNSQKSHRKYEFMAKEAAFNAKREIRGDHCVHILNALPMSLYSRKKTKK
jgi:hypothetical protein